LLVDSPANFDAGDDVRFHGSDALMDTNWGHAIRFVMAQETRPTIEEHNAFRYAHHDPDIDDVKSASQQEIETIYRASYWLPYAPTLPSGLDLFFFDTAVTDGVPEATKALQRALGVGPDGHIGIVTTKAIIAAVRERKLADVLDKFMIFRKAGGVERVAKARAAAKDMIRY
jgi:lysozyme family protein